MSQKQHYIFQKFYLPVPIVGWEPFCAKAMHASLPPVMLWAEGHEGLVSTLAPASSTVVVKLHRSGFMRGVLTPADKASQLCKLPLVDDFVSGHSVILSMRRLEAS